MDKIVLSVFCVLLLGSVAIGIDSLYPLSAGLVLFFAYSKYKGFSLKQYAIMCIEGVKKASTILLTFLLIGILTAFWRASGCIAAIVYYASNIIRAELFLPLAFLMNCLVSFLTGTAFGTAATMGVISMSMASAWNISMVWTGGAILSGAFFGDRFSPVSTSAILTATLTGTNLFDNLKRMIKTTVIPFVLTLTVYFIAGRFMAGKGGTDTTATMLGQGFLINPICLIPAVLVLGLAVCRVNVKTTMMVSSASAAAIAFLVQKMPASELIACALSGYKTAYFPIATMINGGGIVSMTHAAGIVLIASCYSGIFEKTGLLDFLKDPIFRLSKRKGNYLATALISIPASAVACNQTLAILLTCQLTDTPSVESKERAINLEDSVVVIAPLIPWSIASAVPLSSVGAPTKSILFACFLYFVPLCRLIFKRRAS